MRERSVFVILLALVTGGCGGSSAPTGPPVALETSVPAVADCPNFVADVETGPTPADFSGDSPLAVDQDRLRGDARRVHDYGEQHAEDFGSLRYVNSPRVRLVIGFTDRLAEHCAALRQLLEFPDEFELVRDPVPEVTLLDIKSEITQLASDYVWGVGCCKANRVIVNLWADGEHVAAQIVERYGDLVEVTVGVLSYPERTLDEGGACNGPLPPPPSQDLPLVATFELDDSEVASGSRFSGVVTVTNTSESVVEFESGSPLTAYVLRRGSSEVVGVLTGVRSGVGVGANLTPGETIEIEVRGGTASCDPSVGYALPSGDYEVRVPVELYEYPAGNFELHAILTEPAPLIVTEAAPTP